MKVFPAGRKKEMKFFRWRCLSQSLQYWMKQIQGLILMRLRIVANGVNKLRKERQCCIGSNPLSAVAGLYRSWFCSCFIAFGCIVKSGGKELALELEERGYDFIKNELLWARRSLVAMNWKWTMKSCSGRRFNRCSISWKLLKLVT